MTSEQQRREIEELVADIRTRLDRISELARMVPGPEEEEPSAPEAS